MNGKQQTDVRDERLGAVMDRLAGQIDTTPGDRLPEVLRRGSRRRTARFTAIGAAVAIFAGAVGWVGLSLPADDAAIPADVSDWRTVGSLRNDGWTMQTPPSWRVQEVAPCQGEVIRRAVTVTNVDVALLDRRGNPVGCWEGIVWAGFPRDGVVFMIEPEIPFGILERSPPVTPFPLTPDALEYRHQVVGGPLHTMTAVKIPGHHAPVALVSRWVGPDASTTDVNALDRLLGSLQVRGASRWTESGGTMRALHDERHRYTVTYPEDWLVADENLTPWLAAPEEILSLGTFSMPVSDATEDGLRLFDAPVAPAALLSMGAGDAFISLQERRGEGLVGFDERPIRFGPLGCDLAIYGCRPSDDPDLPDGWPDPPFRAWWIPFQDAGRGFYLFVAIGTDASQELTDQTWDVADSLSFEASP